MTGLVYTIVLLLFADWSETQVVRSPVTSDYVDDEGCKREATEKRHL